MNADLLEALIRSFTCVLYYAEDRDQQGLNIGKLYGPVIAKADGQGCRVTGSTMKRSVVPGWR